MKLDLKKIYLIVSIAFMVIVVSSETVVHAKMRRLISSMAVSDNLLFIGEMGGRIEIFDMNKLDVVARPSIAHSPQLVNDNGRILAITSWGFDLRIISELVEGKEGQLRSV